MRIQVQKSGNGVAIRIPKAFARKAGLEDGGEVEFSIENGRLVVVPVGVPPVAPSYNLDELLAGIQPSNLHAETDWGPAVGKEVAAT